MKKSICILLITILTTVPLSICAEIDSDTAWAYIDVFNEYCDSLGIPIKCSMSADPAIAVITDGWQYKPDYGKTSTIKEAILGPEPEAIIEMYYIPHKDEFIFATNYHKSDIQLMTVYTDYGTFFPIPLQTNPESRRKTSICFTAEQIRYILLSSNVEVVMISDYNIETVEFSLSSSDLIAYSAFAILDCFSFCDSDSPTFSNSIHFKHMSDYLYLLEK